MSIAKATVIVLFLSDVQGNWAVEPCCVTSHWVADVGLFSTQPSTVQGKDRVRKERELICRI